MEWRDDFMERHPWCEVCPVILESVGAGRSGRHLASDPHHRRLTGQQGASMVEENVIATCRIGHDWIHRNVDRACELGLIVSSRHTDFRRLAEDPRERPTCVFCLEEFTKPQWEDRHDIGCQVAHEMCCEANGGCDLDREDDR